MKKIIIFFIFIISLTLVGCDSNEEKDINITSTTQYINTTESVKISSFNGLRLVGSEIIKSKDGGYKVILDFDKLFN